MFKKSLTFIIVIVMIVTSLCLATPNFTKADEDNSTKILFIGNSMTAYDSYNSLPNIFQSLIETNDVNAEVVSITHLGISLGDYANGYAWGELTEDLLKYQYDVIVLQDTTEYTTGIWNGYTRNVQNIMNVLKEYNQLGAKIVLYSTNGCIHYPSITYDEYEFRTYSHILLAKSIIEEIYPGTEVVVARAGEWHKKAREINPSNSLLMPDGNHPNYTGYYVSAMCIFDTLWPGQLAVISDEMEQYKSLISIQEQSIQYGDVNNDKAVDADDAVLILQHYAKTNNNIKISRDAADVNGDNLVDSDDAVLILQRYANLILQFPIET